MLLLFLLHNLLEEEVEEYSRSNPFDPICDPSDECIQYGFVAAGMVSTVSTTFSTKGRGGCPGPSSLESEVLIILRFDDLT